MKVGAVLPAGGIGSRMGFPTAKQLLEIHGRTILEHCLSNMAATGLVDHIVVVTSEALLPQVRAIVEHVSQNCTTSLEAIMRSSDVDSRHSSIKTGVDHLQACGGYDVVVIHDAVRPIVPKGLLQNLIEEAAVHGAAGPYVPLVSTVLEISEAGFLKRTIPRYVDNGSLYVASEMPQVFKCEVIHKAYSLISDHELMHGTECLELVRKYADVEAKMIPGDQGQLWKVTYPRDLHFAEKMLRQIPM